MSKTIFNNLNKEIKSLIKNLCETHSNNTIDIIIKNQIKNSINGIVSKLDEYVLIKLQKVIMCKYKYSV